MRPKERAHHALFRGTLGVPPSTARPPAILPVPPAPHCRSIVPAGTGPILWPRTLRQWRSHARMNSEGEEHRVLMGWKGNMIPSISRCSISKQYVCVLRFCLVAMSGQCSFLQGRRKGGWPMLRQRGWGAESAWAGALWRALQAGWCHTPAGHHRSRVVRCPLGYTCADYVGGDTRER